MTRAPILSPSYVWHNAASHSDPERFRQRMKARQQAAQTKPVASVTAIKPPKKDTKA